MDWSSSASRLGPRSYSYLTITHGLLEGGQLGLPRLRPLQLRDPNPDEAEPVMAFGELFCELDAHIREDRLIEHVGGESPLPQVGLESLEPNLDADRAERRSLGPSSEEHVVGHIPNRRFDPGPVRDVLVERPFDADRFRIGSLLDGQFFDAARYGPQPDRILAHELLQLGAGEPGQVPDRPDSDPFEHLCRFRTDSAYPGYGQRV